MTMRRIVLFCAAFALTSCEGRPGGLTGVTPLNLPPTKLSMISQPTDEAVATNLTPVVQVAVQNASNQTVTSSSANISVVLNATNGAVLTGTTLNNPASSGIAVFSDLRVDRAGTGYTLTFSSPGLASVTSAPFNIQ